MTIVIFIHVPVVHFSKTETNTQHPKPGHHRGKKWAKMGHLATMATNYLPVTIHIIPSEARSLLGVQPNVCGFARILKCRSQLLDQHLLSSLLYTLLSSFSIPWRTDKHYRVTIGPIPDSTIHQITRPKQISFRPLP